MTDLGCSILGPQDAPDPILLHAGVLDTPKAILIPTNTQTYPK